MYDELKKLYDSDIYPMHMPGHKRRSIEEIANMSNRNLERWTVLESPLKGRGMSSGHPFRADRSEVETGGR